MFELTKTSKVKKRNKTLQIYRDYFVRMWYYLQILKDYERNSGHQINFLKPLLQFRYKVSDGIHLELLLIITIGGMVIYLGIPESFGGSIIQIL